MPRAPWKRECAARSSVVGWPEVIDLLWAYSLDSEYGNRWVLP